MLIFLISKKKKCAKIHFFSIQWRKKQKKRRNRKTPSLYYNN